LPWLCILVGDVFVATGVHNLMGQSGEFPTQYHRSMRSLTPAIMAARPHNPQDYKPPLILQEPKNNIFKMNLSALGIDVSELRAQVTKVVELFAESPLVGTQDLKSITGSYDALTSYADYYNVYYLDSPAVGKLYWAIKAAFHEYAAVHKINLTRVYFLHGWFNCNQAGEALDWHGHGACTSGNVAIHVPPGSYTEYMPLGNYDGYQRYWEAEKACRQDVEPACNALENPMMGLDTVRYAMDLPRPSKMKGASKKFPNANGELVFFHGMSRHRTGKITPAMREYLAETGPLGCRMTSAFDIHTKPLSMHHTVPLYDPEDPWWERDPRAGLGDRIGAAMEDWWSQLKVPMAFQMESKPTEDSWKTHMSKVFELNNQIAPKLSRLQLNAAKAAWAEFREGNGTAEGSIVQVKFENRGASILHLLWHNLRQNQEMLQGSLIPGSTLEREGFPGKVWLICGTRSCEQPLKTIVTTSAPSQSYVVGESPRGSQRGEL